MAVSPTARQTGLRRLRARAQWPPPASAPASSGVIQTRGLSKPNSGVIQRSGLFKTWVWRKVVAGFAWDFSPRCARPVPLSWRRTAGGGESVKSAPGSCVCTRVYGAMEIVGNTKAPSGRLQRHRHGHVRGQTRCGQRRTCQTGRPAEAAGGGGGGGRGGG